MVLYSFTCFLLKCYDMVGINDRLQRVEKVHVANTNKMKETIGKILGQLKQEHLAQTEAMAIEEIKEVYYLVNILSFVVSFLATAASAYIKWSLRERLLFTLA